MSKAIETDIIKREVGEKVRFNLSVDTAATKDLGDGVLEATITTSNVDRHNESIDTTGIDTSNYMDNPVVLYGHDYFGFPIGKTIKLTETKNKIKAKFQLAIEEYDFADTAYKLIKGGYLNAVSIGGIVREWSEDFKTIKKMEMIEFSIVSIPANADAIITSRSFEELTGKSLEVVHKEYEEFTKGNILDKVADMPDDEVNQAVDVLEKLTAALKESAKANSLAGENTPREIRRIKHITMRDSAKAVATQSQRVIKTIKLRDKE